MVQLQGRQPSGGWQRGARMAALGMVLLAGCREEPSRLLTAVRPKLALTGASSVSMTPTSPTVQVGDSVKFSATGYDSTGTPVTSDCGWSSSDTLVATIDWFGVAHARSEGWSQIRTSCRGAQDSTSMTVTSRTSATVAATATAATVTVTPVTSSLRVAGTVQLTAVARDSSGNVLAGKTFTWASSAPAVASVSAGGLVTAQSVGAANISASVDGRSGSASVSVTQATTASVAVTPASASLAVGGTVQLTATAYDSAGNVIPGRPVTWSSSAPSVASVSSSGLVSAQAAGTAVVTATIDARTGSSSLTVTSPPSTGGSFFTDGFESGGYAGAQNGASWQLPGPANVTVSTEVAHSGTHSLKFSFPGKADCQDASAEQRFSLGRPMQELWLEWYVYFPAGGEGGSASYYHRWEYNCPAGSQSDNNKFVAVFGPNYSGETTSVIQTWTTTLASSVPPTSPGDSRIQTAFSLAGQKGVVYNAANYNPFVSGAGDRGRWMQIRLHFRVADFGQKNGVIQMWKDGAMILSNTTLAWYDSSNTANYLTQGYLLGWSNSGYAQTTNIYIDDFRLIDTNPGW